MMKIMQMSHCASPRLILLRAAFRLPACPAIDFPPLPNGMACQS